LNDLDQLPDHARKSLKESLFMLADKYQGKSSVITIQLCLAITGMLLQSDDDIAQDVIQILGKSKGEQKSMKLTLSLLRLLAEEMHNARLPITESRRSQIGHEMESVSNRVVEFFENSIDLFGHDQGTELTVLFSLTAWLKNGFISSEQIGNSKCLVLALDRVGERDCDEKIYDLICEVVQQTSRNFGENINLLRTIYLRFPLWRQVYQNAIGEEDEDTMRGMVRVFVEYGETCINLIVPNVTQFALLLDCLLEFSGNSNLEIADIPSRFWYMLAETFSEDPYSAFKQHFTVYYERLAMIVLNQLNYPQVVTEWKSSDYDEFSRYRHEVGDLLKDCSFMLGSAQCVELVFRELQKQVQRAQLHPASWQPIEACLFAIRTLGSVVKYEATEKVTVQEILRLYSSIPSHPKIKYTANLIIGRYAEYLEGNPELLKFCVDYLLTGLENTEVAASAALALKHVCRYCAVDMVSSMDALIALYFTLAPHLRMVDQMEILEGLCHVIRHMSPISLVDRYLGQLHEPLRLRILTFIESSQPLDMHTVLSLSRDLESLGTLYKFITDIEGSKRILDTDHPCVRRFSEAWPVYRELLVKYPSEVHLMDSLCKLLHRYLDVYRQAALSQLPIILRELGNAHLLNSLACYLYVIGEAIYDYGYTLGLADTLKEIYQLATEHSVGQLSNPSTLAEKSDMIDEFYRLQKTTLDSYPIAVQLSPDLLSQVLRCSLVCLSLNQKETVTSVLQALDSFYKLLLHMRATQHSGASTEYRLNATTLTQIAVMNFGVGGEFLVFPILRGCAESTSVYSGLHLPVIGELFLCVMDAHGATVFLTHLRQVLTQITMMTSREQQEILDYFSRSSMDASCSPIELHIQHLSTLLKRVFRACRSRQSNLSTSPSSSSSSSLSMRS
jgi:transportin-3